MSLQRLQPLKPKRKSAESNSRAVYRKAFTSEPVKAVSFPRHLRPLAQRIVAQAERPVPSAAGGVSVVRRFSVSYTQAVTPA